MKMQGVKIDPAILSTLPQGRVDEDRLDTTREQDIKRQQRADDAQSMQDAARFARRVRKRLGLTQAEFSKRVDEPINTIRSWEQGKRCPTGAAKALLKLLDKIPEKALCCIGLMVKPLGLCLAAVKAVHPFLISQKLCYIILFHGSMRQAVVFNFGFLGETRITSHRPQFAYDIPARTGQGLWQTI